MLIRDNAMSKWSQLIDNGDMNVYLVKGVERMETENGSVTFLCKAEETVRDCWANYYNTSLPQLKGIGNIVEVKVIINFISQYAFNFKMGFEVSHSIDKTPMIVDPFIGQNVDLKIKETDDEVVIDSGALRLNINKRKALI